MESIKKDRWLKSPDGIFCPACGVFDNKPENNTVWKSEKLRKICKFCEYDFLFYIENESRKIIEHETHHCLIAGEIKEIKVPIERYENIKFYAYPESLKNEWLD